MKGTYDNGAEFFIEMYNAQEDDPVYTGKYDDFDGRLVNETLFSSIEHNNIIHYCVYGIRNGLGVVPAKIDKRNIVEMGTFAHLDRPLDDEVTFEYQIAEYIGKKYKSLNITDYKYALAFLERYVLPFEEVRDFQQTGNLNLSNISKTYGNIGKKK